MTTLKLGSKKTLLVIAFPIALTPDVKVYGLIVRWLFVSTNGIQMKCFWSNWFKKFNSGCLLLTLLIYLSKTETILSFVYPFGLSHSSWHQGLKYIPPSFWSYRMMLSEYFWITDSLAFCCFTANFHEANFVWENLYRSWRSYKVCDMLTCWPNIKNHKNPKLELW